MIEAVFISDLHLSPDDVLITQRFNTFIQWAKENTRSLYILGDFLHVWPGDEALNSWSQSITQSLASLSETMPIYLMAGNRDFLLGKKFFTEAKVQRIKDPYVMQLGDASVLLSHGDRYCINDKSHQWLRCLTRNRIFYTVFLAIPFFIRKKMVQTVRTRSQINRSKSYEKLAIVPDCMIKHMDQFNAKTIIHGHTHQPGLRLHNNGTYKQFILSDWDDNPHVLCYDKANGFYFDLIKGD
ncbi:UDP-2,3-diacylglucosamine hydrolase (plasmid) [Legionella adelaidensis]|uniref:UDP-2,3-diacylglucosamine hydrolase n=1 Tax=Legionella adelaidensis TaxID=45056 RepID=A0A0W0R1Z7_9GAMM|nr:UDP-2,3-diacylglucosamine diphosphatase [Legionella adelaidensis]KTC65116.1 UDP-2,3-diacylglucosamine hydrolase [Legionella adelaidensis]VEH85364.1 UDP-2,3-diacylglucosamine hydrolase [Legionella adelaidensis]